MSGVYKHLYYCCSYLVRLALFLLVWYAMPCSCFRFIYFAMHFLIISIGHQVFANADISLIFGIFC